MPVLEKQISVDEFDAFQRQPENRGRLFELINGEIVRKMPTEEEEVEILTEHVTLSGGELLPGFAMPVIDIFKDPLEE